MLVLLFYNLLCDWAMVQIKEAFMKPSVIFKKDEDLRLKEGESGTFEMAKNTGIPPIFNTFQSGDPTLCKQNHTPTDVWNMVTPDTGTPKLMEKWKKGKNECISGLLTEQLGIDLQ